jgi:hypothetical protein
MFQYWRYAIEDWWRNLPARRWVNSNPKIAIRLSCASFAVLLVVVIWVCWPSCEVKKELPPNLAWFYDLNTGKLFVAGIDETPPIAAPSGSLPDGGLAGVRAFVLSYVKEPNESERFIGFLQTAQAGSDKPVILVRTVNDANWIALASLKGRSIVQNSFKPNQMGRMPHVCSPKYQPPFRRHQYPQILDQKPK